MRRWGVPTWPILTTALLAGTFAIALSQGHPVDAIIVGLFLVPNAAFVVVLGVVAVTGKQRSKKTSNGERAKEAGPSG